MSSILKALKKLEEETADVDSSQAPPPEVMRRSVQRRSGSRFTVGRVVLIGVSVVVLVVLVIFLKIVFTEPPDNDLSGPQAIAAKKESSPLAPSSKVAKPITKPPAPAEAKDAGPEPVPAVEPTPIIKPNPRLKKSTQVPRPPVEQPVKPRVTKPEPVQAPIIKSKAAPAQPAGSRPNLKIDGILWSAKAERRQVLISDKYLKEGDEIKGVKIIKIEKRSVTVGRGKQTWTFTM